MQSAVINVEWIKWAYPSLNKYFGFKYDNIYREILYSTRGNIKNQTTYFETKNIDHLPDDFGITFPLENFDEVVKMINSYDFSCNNGFGVLLILLCICSNNVRDCTYGVEDGLEVNDLFIVPEKRRLYEFLLDNRNEYDWHMNNLSKTQITINYGFNSQITIDNHENWLHNLLKEALYQDLTFGGRFEYNRNESPVRPANAPKFHNFMVYNLYLLLMEIIGSDKEYPVIFLKFIIDFCDVCHIELVGRQHEVLGIKDLLKGAKKQYGNQPIPFSLIR